MRRSLVLVPMLALAIGAAGCGAKSTTYAPAPTAKCLRVQGFEVSTKDADVGFIAAAAPLGGLRAKSPEGNTLVIAFGATAKDVPGLKAGLRRFAPKRIDLTSIMEDKRNAVLLWTVSPTPTELEKALACLSG